MNFLNLKSILFSALAAWIAFAASGQTEASRKAQYNLSRGIAVGGYDPVSYFKGTPVEGSDKWRLTHRGVVYLFSSRENLDSFRAKPEKYEPAYGGWCAYAMGENGEKVKIDPETYKIIDGKLYLFYNFWGNNTRRSWDKDESHLKAAADRNWQKFNAN